MRTKIPIECNASAATNRLSWSWTMNRSTTKVSMPSTTAIKAFTFGGCRRTHTDAMWIGFLAGLMRWNDCYPFFFCKVAGLTGGGGGLIFRRAADQEKKRWTGDDEIWDLRKILRAGLNWVFGSTYPNQLSLLFFLINFHCVSTRSR